MNEQPTDTSPQRPLSICARLAIAILVLGYLLDLYLGRSIVAGSGLDPSMEVSWSSDPDNPAGQVSLAVAMLLALGHVLLMFSTLLWRLGRKAGDFRFPNAGNRFALALGLAGLLGLFTLFSSAPLVSARSFTHLETLLLDLCATMAILAGALFAVSPGPTGVVRGYLYSALAATAVTAATAFVDTSQQPWVVVIFGVAGLVALRRISQLLELFGQAATTSQEPDVASASAESPVTL